MSILLEFYIKVGEMYQNPLYSMAIIAYIGKKINRMDLQW